MNIGKRLLLFLHWLISLVVVVFVVMGEKAEEILKKLLGTVGAPIDRVILIGMLVVYAIVSVAVLCMILKRGSKRAARGFITVDSAETGGVRIAVSAIEQMVKQAVRAVEGIAEMKIAIANDDDAISIDVNVTVISGSHVPTVTMNMQRAIRQFVEMNCGVAVRSVSVNVQAVVVPAENGRKSKKFDLKPAQAPMAAAVPAVSAAAAAEEWTVEATEPAAAEPAVEEPAATEEVYEEPAAEEYAVQEYSEESTSEEYVPEQTEPDKEEQ